MSDEWLGMTIRRDTPSRLARDSAAVAQMPKITMRLVMGTATNPRMMRRMSDLRGGGGAVGWFACSRDDSVCIVPPHQAARTLLSKMLNGAAQRFAGDADEPVKWLVQLKDQEDCASD